MWNPNVILNHAETIDAKPLQSHVVLAIGQLFWPRDSRCRHSHSKQRFSDGASTLFATLGRRWHLPPACWLKSRRLPRPRVLIRGSCAIGAAQLRCLTLCKFLEWLAVTFRTWNTKVILNHAETSDGKPLQSHVVLAMGGFMHTAPETSQNEMVFDPNPNEIKKRIQQLPHGERTINESAAHIYIYIKSCREVAKSTKSTAYRRLVSHTLKPQMGPASSI